MNNRLRVKCINDLVDGITKGKIYNVSVVQGYGECLSYFFKDDYGVYNEFRSERFEIVECYIKIQ